MSIGSAFLALLLLQETGSLLERGRRYLDEKDLDAAEIVFRELSSRNPNDARASYYLGLTLSRQGRTGEAIEVLEKARDLAPHPNPSVLYELGTALSREKRWKEAESTLEQAVALAPQEITIRLQLGWVYYSNVEGEKARAEFEKVLQTSPSAPAFLYLGLTEIGLGENERAIRALEEAIRLDGSLLEAHLALGKTLARAGRDDEARPVLLHALDLDSRAAEAHFQLGLIALRRGEIETAWKSFDAAIAADSEHLKAWYNRALVAERLGREEDAREAWKRVSELRAAGASDTEPKTRARAREK